MKGLSAKKIPLHSGEDPSKKVAELMDKAKQMKNAKTADEKVAATKAYESAMDKRRQANKAKQAEAHKFKNPWTRTRSTSASRCGREGQEDGSGIAQQGGKQRVSVRHVKANYMDPHHGGVLCGNQPVCGAIISAMTRPTWLGHRAGVASMAWRLRDVQHERAAGDFHKVAWCKRCDPPRLFPNALKDKFNWAMGVEGDWRFEAAEVKKN